MEIISLAFKFNNVRRIDDELCADYNAIFHYFRSLVHRLIGKFNSSLLYTQKHQTTILVHCIF